MSFLAQNHRSGSQVKQRKRINPATILLLVTLLLLDSTQTVECKRKTAKKHEKKKTKRDSPKYAQFLKSNDYYTILGVTKKADTKAIKKAYRQLALAYHPDKLTGDEEEKEIGEEIFV